nr:MAG TPA: hypothetical protein [Caudoviricetes sp.]
MQWHAMPCRNVSKLYLQSDLSYHKISSTLFAKNHLTCTARCGTMNTLKETNAKQKGFNKMKYVLTFQRKNDYSRVECNEQQIIGIIQNYLLDCWVIVWIKEVK